MPILIVKKTFHCRLVKLHHEGSSELKVPSLDFGYPAYCKILSAHKSIPTTASLSPPPPFSHILLTTIRLTLLICGLASGKTVYLLPTAGLTVGNISKGDFLRNRAMEGGWEALGQIQLKQHFLDLGM